MDLAVDMPVDMPVAGLNGVLIILLSLLLVVKDMMTLLRVREVNLHSSVCQRSFLIELEMKHNDARDLGFT